jgi:hypothetical protein
MKIGHPWKWVSGVLMRNLFILLLIVAVVMVGQRLLVEMRPYILLDVVLTPEELRDERTHDTTLELMQKATSYDSTFWLTLGAIVAGLAIVALFLSKAAKQLPKGTGGHTGRAYTKSNDTCCRIGGFSAEALE